MQKDGNETDKDVMDMKELNTKCWGGGWTGLRPEQCGCLMVMVNEAVTQVELQFTLFACPLLLMNTKPSWTAGTLFMSMPANPLASIVR